MEQHNQHIIYSADQIRQYLEGRMTHAEMHALEKAALDDPFLAEAIEGYESIPADNWQPQLDTLHTTFAQPARTAPAKVISIGKPRINWFRYAAAIFIIAGLSTTFLLVNRNNRQDTGNAKTVVAITDDSKVSAPATNAIVPQSRQAADSARAVTTTKPGTKDVAGLFDKGTQSPVTLQDNLNIRMDSAFAFTPRTIAAETSSDNQEQGDVAKAKEVSPDPNAESKKFNAAPPVVSSNATINNGNTQVNIPNGLEFDRNGRLHDYNYFNRERKNPYDISNFYSQDNTQRIVAQQQRSPELNNRFLGQIVASDNTPLPFANINIKDEGFGTYADAKGVVRLVSADSILNIEVKSLGYRSRTLKLNANGAANPSKIVLEEEPIAKAEKSAGADTRIAQAKAKSIVSRRAILAATDSAQNVEPEDGWDKYSTYLTNNYNLPQEVTNKNVHGEVAVSFDVDTNGRITNITVDKSLCADCDELAKRLVEQGPQWKVKKGKKAKGRVRIQF